MHFFGNYAVQDLLDACSKFREAAAVLRERGGTPPEAINALLGAQGGQDSLGARPHARIVKYSLQLCAQLWEPEATSPVSTADCRPLSGDIGLLKGTSPGWEWHERVSCGCARAARLARGVAESLPEAAFNAQGFWVVHKLLEVATPAEALPVAAKLLPEALRLTTPLAAQGAWRGNNLLIKLVEAMVRRPARPLQYTAPPCVWKGPLPRVCNIICRSPGGWQRKGMRVGQLVPVAASVCEERGLHAGHVSAMLPGHLVTDRLSLHG